MQIKTAIFISLVSGCASAENAFDPTGGCRGATFPCLPGMDAVGVGYDAVTGKYAGNPVVALNYTDAYNVWPNPFANGTSYSYADQATVMGHTEKTTSHSVYRSVTDYVTSQSHEAHASAHVGMFFKASVETKWASSHMSDSLHIVAVSEYEVGVFSITLKPPVLLEAHADFLKYVDSLPEAYDSAAYQDFITYYGTHYPFQVTLGGRARMKTVVSNAFSSTQSDSSITASVSASWGILGGGGGSSSASNTTTQEWKDNSDINTETVGGDPSINAFCNMTDPQADCYGQGQGWANWVKSVEHGAPVVTSMQLEPVWSLVPLGPKHDNVLKAVQDYASNATWPSANLTQVRMDWCDCEKVESFSNFDPYWSILSCHGSGEYAHNVVCPQGKFPTAAQARDHDHKFETCDGGAGLGWNCCRPCFTAAN